MNLAPENFQCILTGKIEWRTGAKCHKYGKKKNVLKKPKNCCWDFLKSMLVRAPAKIFTLNDKKEDSWTAILVTIVKMFKFLCSGPKIAHFSFMTDKQVNSNDVRAVLIM